MQRFMTAALVGFLAAALGDSAARGEGAPDPKEWEAILQDPAYTGEEVTEQSEIEKVLFTEYRKRRNAHFLFETSYDMESAKDYLAFCEWAYRDFLKWCGKPEDYELWPNRCHVGLIANKAEWECLMMHRNKGRPAHELERLKNIGGQWSAAGPMTLNYSREGSTPEQDKLNLFHTLNHLFLHGLAKSGPDGIVWWLWEGFSILREVDVFGTRGPGCISFETSADSPEDRAWNDIDDWVTLLKRDVRTKQDEDFILFWHKDVMSVQLKTFVKAWSIIRYLTRSDREREEFVKFIELLKTKNDQSRALETALKTDPEELDKAWRTWIKRQPTRWRKSSR